MKCGDVEAAKAMRHLKTKDFLARIAGVTFLLVTIRLVIDPSWKMVAAEAVLGVVLTVFRHYFTTGPSPWIRALELLFRRNMPHDD